VVDYFIRYVTPPKVDLPETKLENKLLAGTSIIGAVIYLILVGLAISITPKRVELTSIPEDTYWQTVELKPTLKEKTVADIKKDLQPITEQKIPLVKPVQPVEKAKPVEKSTTVISAAQNIVNKSLPVSLENTKNVSSSIPASETKTATQTSFKLSDISGSKGGPAQTVKTLSGGALKGNRKTNQPGVETPAGKQAAFTDLKSLSGNLGPVLAKNSPGALNVPFRSSHGGAGTKAGSANKNYNLGGPGQRGALAIPGSGDRMGNWGPGASGPIGGGAISSLRIPGKNHNPVGISIMPQDPLTGPVSLTNEEVLAVIRANLGQIRHCYEQTLQRSPNTEGRVKVRFTIGAGGRVHNQGIIQDAIGNSQLSGCIQSKVARWKFPLPRAGEVNVTYPFEFFKQVY